jgi:hypothetical protein
MLSESYVCSLCGTQFDPASTLCHTSCPLSAGCHVICCPTCGYQAPDENQMPIAGTLKRLWTNWKDAHPTTPETSA